MSTGPPSAHVQRLMQAAGMNTGADKLQAQSGYYDKKGNFVFGQKRGADPNSVIGVQEPVAKKICAAEDAFAELLDLEDRVIGGAGAAKPCVDPSLLGAGDSS